MRKQSLLTRLACAIPVLIAGTIAQAQSNYSNLVMSYGPAAYWPLQETVQPPSSFKANNLGTLGSAGNGYYYSWWLPVGNSFVPTNAIVLANNPATLDGGTAFVSGATNEYLVFPRFNPGVTLKPPFSIEVWCYPTVANSAAVAGIVAEGRGSFIGQTNVNYGANAGGAILLQFQNFFGFDLYSTNGTAGQPELRAPLTANTWHYLVATFDGTNAALYLNGNLTTGVIGGGGQAPSNPFALITTNAAGQHYAPDPITPLFVGTGPNYNSPPFQGQIDELAIYTNILQPEDIQAHYYAAFTGNYGTTVQASSPGIFVRFDDPAYVPPATNTWPVANSYGTLGTNANGLYQPGTAPGIAGPPFDGFAATNYAVGIPGIPAGVEIGGGGNLQTLAPALNPTGKPTISVTAWFKVATDSQSAQRLQNIMGHSDKGWRLVYERNAANRFNPGFGTDFSFASNLAAATNGFYFNGDGAWHFIAGVTDGTNEFLYLDGRLALTNAVGTNTAVGSPLDIFLGGDPQYTLTGANNRFFGGSLAHVAFFTNALTAAQVQNLYIAADLPPYITAPLAPSFSTANAGTLVTYGLPAGGTPPLAYQWYKGSIGSGTVVVGQTNGSLLFNPVAGANAGTYYAIVSNSYGSATSSIVSLTVLTAPVITSQVPPGGTLSLYAGATPTFSVSASGASPFSYQWFNGTTALAGATNSTLVFGGSAGTYTCRVSNSLGSATNAAVAVTVLAAPTNAYPATVMADGPVAYWRLDETIGATTANDYVGGYNGAYSLTALGQPGYNPSVDADTAAGFGPAFGEPVTNSFVGNVPFNFANNLATNGNAEFTVEAWVNGTALQTTDAGILTVGWGGGGEQVNLDTGAAGHSIRFFVRNVAGTQGAAASTFMPTNGNWHQLVGVCDQSNGIVVLYVDGVSNSSGAFPANTGLLNARTPLSIGSREAGNVPGVYNNQFSGAIDEVAVYNKVLTPAQVLSHFEAAAIPPLITQQPLDQLHYPGYPASFSVQVGGGSPPFTYQWYSNGVPVAGATSSTYTAGSPANGSSYYCIVSNLHSFVTSSTATLTYVTAPTTPFPAQVLADHPIAFWRLDEASGAVAYDYVGGNNGSYANVAQGVSPGYSASSDPSELASGFGPAFFEPASNSYVGNIPLNLSVPNGGNGEFSIEAWINGGFTAQTTDAGIVALGYGGGGEEFSLDTGAAGHALRFYVHNSAGVQGTVNSTFSPADNVWHHVVAVCDQTNNAIHLYVDGLDVGDNNAGGVGTGILNPTTLVPLSIGSREGGLGTSFNNQFSGSIDDVAIYNYALSAAQVQSHYVSIGVAPGGIL